MTRKDDYAATTLPLADQSSWPVASVSWRRKDLVLDLVPSPVLHHVLLQISIVCLCDVWNIKHYNNCHGDSLILHPQAKRASLCRS